MNWIQKTKLLNMTVFKYPMILFIKNNPKGCTMKSLMIQEVHLRFCERFRGKIPLYLLDFFFFPFVSFPFLAFQFSISFWFLFVFIVRLSYLVKTLFCSIEPKTYSIGTLSFSIWTILFSVVPILCFVEPKPCSIWTRLCSIWT
jgi:hypothetical protein